jgi:nondiscriminating glutamyl-tRNA synthetase
MLRELSVEFRDELVDLASDQEKLSQQLEKLNREDIILKELDWLGIDVDEGAGIGGDYGPYRQSDRIDIYKKYLEKLIEEDKAYYCYCTAEELEAMRERAKAKGEMPGYNGHCRNLTKSQIEKFKAEGRKPVVRFKTPLEDKKIVVKDQIRGDVSFDSSILDDFIIFKSDGMPTYNFAVVIDDSLMKVTDVMRGEDHLSNTPKQILLYQAFGFELPNFSHLPLILDENKAKLKKRSDKQTVYVGEFRERGYLAEALFNFLALLGWAPKNDDEILSKEELVNNFNIKDVNKSAAVFDVETWCARLN